MGFFGRRGRGTDPLALLGRSRRLVAGRQFAQALPLLEEAVERLNGHPGRKAALGESLEYLARTLEALDERPRDRADAALRAVALLDQPPYPDRRSALRRVQLLSLACNALARCGDARELAGVRAEAAKAAEYVAKIAPDLRHEMAGQFAALAAVHATLGEFAEASAALAVFLRYRSDPEFAVAPAVALKMARNLQAVANKLTDHGENAEAIRVYDLTIEAFRELRDGSREQAERSLALSLNQKAWNLCVLGAFAEALPLAEEAVEMLRPPSGGTGLEDRLVQSAAFDTFATALAMAGRTDEALDACRESLVIARELAAADPAKYRGLVALVELLQARIEGREAGGFADRATPDPMGNLTER